MKRYFKISLTLFITLIIVLGFAMPLNPAGNWYQQFMPNLGGRNITDIFFLDSLTGWSVTNATNQANDTTFVLKTTNSGDNWVIQYRKIQTGGGFPGYFRVYFLNQSTGYVCGVTGIDKTTNGGTSWVSLNAPLISYLDMSILSTDTIWIVSSNSLTGGVFRTTNGGASWEWQLNIGSLNPTNIYFYNGTTGYISYNGGGAYVRRTTNSGVNWTVNVTGEGFTDMYFADALTGYRSYGTMKKTTDGGLSWISQVLPSGGQIITSTVSKISVLNRDTVWGVGGQIFYGGSQTRGIIYRTVNGGTNWQFQAPDTAYNIFIYNQIKFTNRLNGWAYSGPRGVHTITGGDPVWLTGIEQISSEVPKEFILYQNYPNPFNPKTNIKYQITKSNSNVKLVIFDITGKEIINLVDREQDAGTYHVDFSGTGYSSGVYFYKLTVTTAKEVFTDTKRMLMVK